MTKYEKKINFLKFQWPKFQKWKKKLKCQLLQDFALSKSVSKQKINSIKQILQELLNFKGENWTYLYLYRKSNIFDNRADL